MNRAIALIDLLAPENIMHGATRAAEVASWPRGEERDSVLDPLLNDMRSDIGVSGKVANLRRTADGGLSRP